MNHNQNLKFIKACEAEPGEILRFRTGGGVFTVLVTHSGVDFIGGAILTNEPNRIFRTCKIQKNQRCLSFGADWTLDYQSDEMDLSEVGQECPSPVLLTSNGPVFIVGEGSFECGAFDLCANEFEEFPPNHVLIPVFRIWAGGEDRNSNGYVPILEYSGRLPD
jgi:hypothetical protein